LDWSVTYILTAECLDGRQETVDKRHKTETEDK